jgi:hypothetical protein
MARQSPKQAAAEARKKASAAAKRARERYQAGEAQFAVGVLVGGAAAGALSGYDIGFEVGEMDIGLGGPIGAALIISDGMGSQLAKGAGYGMVAGELALFMDELIGDMMDGDGDDDGDDDDDDDDDQ